MKGDSYHESCHPIGVVCRRTGLKPDLLRAWEKRFGAVHPVRSSGNLRLYSDADIEKLQFLHRAIKGGRRIGQIAALSPQELEVLVAADSQSTPSVRTLRSRVGRQDIEDRVTNCLAAVQDLDARELELQLEGAAVALSQPHLLERVVAPVMERIGDLWNQGSLRVAHEHLASRTVGSFLSGLLSQSDPSQGAPRALICTPLHQGHEMGALIISVMAAFEGWAVTYLGHSLPAEEIAAAVHQKSPRVVALSIGYPPDDARLPEELRKLSRHLGDASLVAGGRSAKAYREVLEEIGAIRVKDLVQFKEVLRDLRVPEKIAT
jgi:DNA-binding transcriptional MerR regulator/methylmalonyl-CoA mutase cobalamin-binding subunit